MLHTLLHMLLHGGLPMLFHESSIVSNVIVALLMASSLLTMSCCVADASLFVNACLQHVRCS